MVFGVTRAIVDIPPQLAEHAMDEVDGVRGSAECYALLRWMRGARYSAGLSLILSRRRHWVVGAEVWVLGAERRITGAPPRWRSRRKSRPLVHRKGFQYGRRIAASPCREA